MSPIVQWSLIVGFFLPPVQALVQQAKWSNKVRAGVNFAACAVAGAGVAYFQGDLTGERFVQAGLTVLVAAIATYKGTWKPSGIAGAVEEKSTKALGL